MRIISALSVCFFIALASCNNQPKEDQASQKQEQPSAPPSSQLSDSATQKLVALMSDYYALKDAFTKDNEAAVTSTAQTLNTNAANFRTMLATDSTHYAAIKTSLDTIITSASGIGKLYPEGLVEKSRPLFEKISDNMYTLLKKAALKNAKVYRQFCPMAFNDKGAYWLSNEEEIKNPYFGKKMLECGEVTDTLQ